MISSAGDENRFPYNKNVARMKKSPAFLLILIFWACVAVADQQDVVRSIEFTGNKKMRASRMLQYMDTKVGLAFDQKTLDGDIERLKSWWYFEYVRPTVDRREDGVYISVAMKEKWTVIPEIEIKSGGGVTAVRLGIKDTNFLGYRQEAMIYGGWRSKDWLAGARFIEPNILGSRFGTRIEAKRHFYEDPIFRSPNDPGDPRKLYIADVERLYVDLRFEKELHPLARLGVTGWYSRDTTETAANSPNDDPPPMDYAMPEKSTAVSAGIWTMLGRRVVDHYICRGVTFESSVNVFDSAFGARSDFTRTQADLRFYIPIPWEMNFAGKLFGGWEDSDQFIEQFALGGLDNLRGFLDRRFRGRGAAYANFEYRWMFPWSWWVISWMWVGCADAGIVWDDWDQETNAIDDIHAGAGFGGRLIVTKWDNAITRLDLAWPLEGGPPVYTLGVDMYF